MKISCLIPVFNTPANHLIEAVESKPIRLTRYSLLTTAALAQKPLRH